MAERYQIHVPTVMMRATPDDEAESTNQLLYGETIELLDDDKSGWLHVEAEHDAYKGYIPLTAIGSVHETSHRIIEPLSHVYTRPDFKSAVLSPLYFLSPIAVKDDSQNGFRELNEGGWVFNAHLAAHDHTQTDIVETALKFDGAPYLWGGRSIAGIDCSGLVQIALIAAGIGCPRDTCDQIDTIGQPVEFGDTIQYAALQRGDLVFFERHVGIMIDERNILNATSRHMKTVIEPLANLIDIYNGILAVRRL